MPLHEPKRRSRMDPTVGLVDIVFLLVMFFLLAGTVARPLGSDVDLISGIGQKPVPPPDALVLTETGELQFRGDVTDPTAFVASMPPEMGRIVRIVPDRDAPAALLIQTARALTDAGAASVIIVTERAAQ